MNIETLSVFARQHFPMLCQPRPEKSHKGTFGNVGVIGGNTGMVGAALLAGRAALLQGAGRVYIGFAQTELPLMVDPLHLELMLKTAHHLVQNQTITAWVIGCGLGVDESSLTLLYELFARHPKASKVIDADALNLISQHRINIAQWEGVHVVTPHPLEAARLLGCDMAAIEEDREKAARQLATVLRAWVVLKGHHSIICSPKGEMNINKSGNACLASAGTGDVLAGIIGALLAQGMPIQEAVGAGVWLHGAAADYLVKNNSVPIGITAYEIAQAARTVRNRVLR